MRIVSGKLARLVRLELNSKINIQTTSSAGSVFLGHENAPATATGAEWVAGSFKTERRVKPRAQKPSIDVESAVYSYIQAVRALGKTKLTANEIANSLSLSTIEVNEAITKLHSKGVKIISR